MNIAETAAIVNALNNSGGGGGSSSGVLVLIHIDENNTLDKSYNEIREMLRGGEIPYAVVDVPDDNWVGVYVFMEALYNDDPYDPIYFANSFYMDGGSPSTAVFQATDPDAPLAN